MIGLPGSSLSAAASASASRTIGLGVLLDVGEGADQQLHSLDEFDAEPSLLQLQQEEAEASPEALHRLHGDAVAEQMEAAAADTGAADLALLEAAAQVDAQAETEAEAGSSKFEVFYFSPGPMLYDSGGGTTWKGQSAGRRSATDLGDGDRAIVRAACPITRTAPHRARSRLFRCSSPLLSQATHSACSTTPRRRARASARVWRPGPS